MDAEKTLKLLTKTEQASRIFQTLYERREKFYRKLSGRALFSRKNNEDARRTLIIINDRERRVVNIIKNNKDEILKQIYLAEQYPDMKHNLLIMKEYFDKILAEQENFLNDEREALENNIIWKEFLSTAENYFHGLEEFREIMKQNNKHLFSPKELYYLLKKHENSLPKKIRKIVSEITVFVTMFMGTDAVFMSLKEGSLFDVTKIPDITIFIKMITIGCVITFFNLHLKTLNAIKNHSNKLIYYISLLTQ